MFNLISSNEKVKLENISCTVEWIDHTGIMHCFESSVADSISKNIIGHSVHLSFTKKNCPEMEWQITEEKDNLLIRLSVRNITDETISVKKLIPFLVCQEQYGKMDIAGSLNQAHLLSLERHFYDIKPIWLFDELYIRKAFSSEMMICLYGKSTESALNMGFITTADMFGKFTFNFDTFLNLNKFSASCDTEKTTLMPGEKLPSEKLFVNIDDTAQKGLENYALRVQQEMKSKMKTKPIIGWSTWDFYFGDISEESILDNVNFLALHKKELPVEYIQIDAGYTIEELFEWEKWNKNFPHGPKWLVEKIKAKGFKAGLWLVPFWAHRDSFLAKEHPNWLVKDKDETPAPTGRIFFALDGTHPEVQTYLNKLAEKITKEWGFEYIKIDGASKLGMVKGMHYNSSATSCQAYRQGIKAFRSGMKKGTVFMGGVFGPSIGIVDAMRIGGDAGARWDWSKIPNVHLGERDRYHGSGYIKRTICSTLNASYMNKRLWINDGDYLIVRDDRSELSLNEAQTWATVIGLYGGSVILGDRMTTLSPSRLKILKKIFPICDITATPVDFLKKDIPEVLLADIAITNDHWKIVALFNYSDHQDVKTVSFSELGIDDKQEYHVFGFWKQKYYGSFMNSISIPLEAHSCEILAIRKNKNVPQVLGTDLHITQGGIELDSCEFINNTLKIKTTDRGRIGNIFIFVPDGFEPSDGLKKHSKNVWKYEVNFEGQTIECVFKH